mmetsp:Transcript_32882/g.70744  ORF Transcript_32882/g.70744 Transcript_32882/m.70744 type:complete len:392 (+) Transcript_32882:28-1203(+)
MSAKHGSAMNSLDLLSKDVSAAKERLENQEEQSGKLDLEAQHLADRIDRLKVASEGSVVRLDENIEKVEETLRCLTDRVDLLHEGIQANMDMLNQDMRSLSDSVMERVTKSVKDQVADELKKDLVATKEDTDKTLRRVKKLEQALGTALAQRMELAGDPKSPFKSDSWLSEMGNKILDSLASPRVVEEAHNSAYEQLLRGSFETGSFRTPNSAPVSARSLGRFGSPPFQTGSMSHLNLSPRQPSKAPSPSGSPQDEVSMQTLYNSFNNASGSGNNYVPRSIPPSSALSCSQQGSATLPPGMSAVMGPTPCSPPPPPAQRDPRASTPQGWVPEGVLTAPPAYPLSQPPSQRRIPQTQPALVAPCLNQLNDQDGRRIDVAKASGTYFSPYLAD